MTGVSTLGQVLNQIQGINDQRSLLDTLSTQLNTGKKTQEFSGLRNDVLTSKKSRANFASLETYKNNILNGDRRIKLALVSVEEIQGQTKTLSSALVGLSQESVHQKGDEVFYDDPLTPTIENTRVGMTSAEPDDDFKGLQDLASNLYEIIVDLLNSKDGEKYIFSGADSLTRPVTDTGAIDSAVSHLIGQWKSGAISNDELIADITNGDTTNNPDALSDNLVGFSSALSAGNSGNLTIRASQSVEIDYTVRANEDPFRDILAGLAFLKSADLGPIADTYIPPNSYPGVPDVQGAPGTTLDEMKENFFAVFNAVQTQVESAINGIDNTRFRLEAGRARINDLLDAHKETQNFLQTTIDEIENVNLDEVAVKISTLQIRLEASYAVTAQTQSLSLVNFIS
jgi:flagellin-like hook-associated protein FlgL